MRESNAIVLPVHKRIVANLLKRKGRFITHIKLLYLLGRREICCIVCFFFIPVIVVAHPRNVNARTRSVMFSLIITVEYL